MIRQARHNQSVSTMKPQPSRVPALLIASLVFVAFLIGLRCWTLARDNADLGAQVGALGEALQISTAAYDVCMHDRDSAQRAEQLLGGELPKVREQWEKLRAQIAETKPRLDEADICAAAMTECRDKLTTARQSDEAKYDVINSLRTETQRLRGETLDLVDCKAQLEQVQRVKPTKKVLAEEDVADEREAMHRGVPKYIYKKNFQPKKLRPLTTNEADETFSKINRTISTSFGQFSNDYEEEEVKEVEKEVTETPVLDEKPLVVKTVSSSSTTVRLVAADDQEEEVVSKSTTPAVRKMLRQRMLPSNPAN